MNYTVGTYCPIDCPNVDCDGWCNDDADHPGKHWCLSCDAEWD